MVHTGATPVVARYQRHDICVDWFSTPEASANGLSWEFEIPSCEELPGYLDTYCPDGAQPLAPWWRSVEQAGGSWGPWRLAGDYTCPVDPLPPAIFAAWEQMVIDPSHVAFYPDNGWAIAGFGIVPEIVEDPQAEQVTVLGTDVILRATPTGYSWSTSDDTALSIGATGKGTEDNALKFARNQHRATISVTTTWEGHYSLDGGTTWREAPGEATTASAPVEIHVLAPRVRLVDCDLEGRCGSGRAAPKSTFTLTDPDADGIDNHTIPSDQIEDYLDTRERDRTWRKSERVDLTDR
ncbi:MAG: hypothetical protein ACK5NO_05925 [Demequina sp.]